SLQTDNAQSFRSFQNEVGIKGDIAKGFYRAYIKRRDVLSIYRYTSDVRAGELYVGGALRYDLNERNKINGSAEFLQTGDFKIIGDIENRFFEASYRLKQYQPAVIEQKYFGNHFFWNNNFQSTLTNEISGALKLDLDYLSIRPKISLTTISNFIYYNQEARPEQADENIVLTSYGTDLKFRWFTNRTLGEYFGFDSEIIYTTTGGGDADKYRVPELFYFGKLFWEGYFFENSLQVQIGTDLMYRSAFLGNDYSFATQQFFLQDDTELIDYFLADVFLNFKVEKVRIFFKWNHFNQRNNEGFQITPLYPGQQSVIDLGINWLFFD
ncbi:MAG: putative porin, partial [Cyclobacteriaceae bacterium]